MKGNFGLTNFFNSRELVKGILGTEEVLQYIKNNLPLCLQDSQIDETKKHQVSPSLVPQPFQDYHKSPYQDR